MFKKLFEKNKIKKIIALSTIGVLVLGLVIMKLTGFSFAATSYDPLRPNNDFIFLDPTNANAVCDNTNYWTPSNPNTTCYRFFVVNDSDLKTETINGTTIKYRELILDHDIGFGTKGKAYDMINSVEEEWTSSNKNIIGVSLLTYKNAEKDICGYDRWDFDSNGDCSYEGNTITPNNKNNPLFVNTIISNNYKLSNYYQNLSDSGGHGNLGYWIDNDNEGSYNTISSDMKIKTVTDTTEKRGIRPVIKMNRTLKVKGIESVTSESSSTHYAHQNTAMYSKEYASIEELDSNKITKFEINDDYFQGKSYTELRNRTEIFNASKFADGNIYFRNSDNVSTVLTNTSSSFNDIIYYLYGNNKHVIVPENKSFKDYYLSDSDYSRVDNYNLYINPNLVTYNDVDNEIVFISNDFQVTSLSLEYLSSLPKNSSTSLYTNNGFQITDVNNIISAKFYKGYLYVLYAEIHSSLSSFNLYFYRYNLKKDSSDYGKLDKILSIPCSNGIYDLELYDFDINNGLIYASESIHLMTNSVYSYYSLVEKITDDASFLNETKISKPKITYEYTNDDVTVRATSDTDVISAEGFTASGDGKSIYKVYTKDTINVNDEHSIVFYDRYGNPSDPVTIKPQLRTVALEPTREVNVGQTKNNTLVINVSKIGKTTNAATYSKVDMIFKSSDENIVKVDSNGTLTPIANGWAVITATISDDGKSSTESGKYVSECLVNVTTMPTDFTFNPIFTTLQPNEQVSLNIKVEPDTASYKYISSSKTSNNYGSVSPLQICSSTDPIDSTCLSTDNIDYIFKAGTSVDKTSIVTSNINYKNYNLSTPAASLSKSITFTIKDFIKTLTISNVGNLKTGLSYDYMTKINDINGTIQLDVLLNGSSSYTKIAHPKVNYTSSDSEVVSVDENGLIKNLGPKGSRSTAVITVTADSRYTEGAIIKDDKICDENCTDGSTLFKKILVIAGDEGAVNKSVESISVSPKTITLDPGHTETITYKITPSDATNTKVLWSSSNEDVATVSDSGVIKGIKQGTATITAKTEDGNKTDTVAVTVNRIAVSVSKITLSKSNLDLYVNDIYQLAVTIEPSDADNKAVSWWSDKPEIASVENGLVKGLTPGTAKIYVMTEDGGLSKNCTIAVSKRPNPVTSITIAGTSTIQVGAETQLTATVKPTDADDKTLTWKSSNTNVATVTNGKIKGIAAGTAKITATSVNNIIGEFNVTVIPKTTNDTVIEVSKITLEKSTLEMKKTDPSVKLNYTIEPSNATDKTITWSSSKTSVATVNSTSGLISPVGVGETVITAKASNGISATCTVKVSKDIVNVTKVTIDSKLKNLRLKKKESVDLIAFVEPSNATSKEVEWTSSNSAIAKIENNKLIALTPGEVTITVSAIAGNVNDQITVVVMQPRSITFDNEDGNKQIPKLSEDELYPGDKIKLPEDDGSVRKNQAKLIGWSTQLYNPLEHRLETLNGDIYNLGAEIEIPDEDFTLFALYCLDSDNNNVCDYDDNNEPSIIDDPASPINLSNDVEEEKVNNPPTGVYLYLTETFILICIALTIYGLNKKYDLFKYNK